MTKRINAVRKQWAPFLTGDEYKVIDVILYRTALGESYVLRMKTLVNETGVPEESIRKMMSKWVFLRETIIKSKGLGLEFDYGACINYFLSYKASKDLFNTCTTYNTSNTCNSTCTPKVQEVQEVKVQETPIEDINAIRLISEPAPTMREKVPDMDLGEQFESLFKTDGTIK